MNVHCKGVFSSDDVTNQHAERRRMGECISALIYCYTNFFFVVFDCARMTVPSLSSFAPEVFKLVRFFRLSTHSIFKRDTVKLTICLSPDVFP